MDGNSYRSHREALANFNKRDIKTEVFPRTLGRKIAEAEEIRHASDYDDFFVATKDEAAEQIATAEELINYMAGLCTNLVPILYQSYWI